MQAWLCRLSKYVERFDVHTVLSPGKQDGVDFVESCIKQGKECIPSTKIWFGPCASQTLLAIKVNECTAITRLTGLPPRQNPTLKSSVPEHQQPLMRSAQYEWGRNPLRPGRYVERLLHAPY